MYRLYIKRIIDLVLGLGGLIILGPIFIILCIWIKLDSKGPILFKQKRVGINKTFFYIYKFRTMYIDTPKDMPTHMLKNPDQFITKVGKFLRKTSLDELPQIINILKGEMAIIGPRPALWNQYDLIEERDKYHANDVRPGLTGWAQINGRDELEIPVKAKLDGEYVERISFLFDIKCFFGTVISVLKHDGVVEGGTGKLNNMTEEETDKYSICAITTISKTMDWFVVDSMRNLYKNNFSVTLICNMDNEFISRNKDYAECINIPMSRGLNPINAISSIIKLYRVFKTHNFDLIQYSTPNAALYSSIAGYLAGISKRLYGQWGLRYVGFKGYKRYIFKKIEKITCSLSTTVRGQSPKNVQIAIDDKVCRKDKISVVGLGGTIGVDLNEFNIFKKEEYKKIIKDKFNLNNKFVYGYVGRLNKDKGINELIIAFRKLLLHKDNIVLMLVGMYDETNPIDKELYEWAKLSENIIIVGNVETREVPIYMSSFDIHVHPTYREGFGKVLQEAMAMEIPIITTDVPGPSEVIEDNISGLLVRAKDAVSLENAMNYLYMNTDFCSKLATNARIRAVNNFSRDIMLRNILTDILNILEKG